jgi:hypothetical protein
MSGDQIELTWDPVPADWVDGLRAAVPLYRFAPWFAGAFALAAAVLVVLGQPGPAVFGFGCAVVIAALPAVGVWLSFRRHPVASTTLTARADESSLRMMTLDGTAYTDLDWVKLSGWVETRRGFVLRTDDGRGSPFYPVPNRAFTGLEQRQWFRELLARQIGPASRK